MNELTIGVFVKGVFGTVTEGFALPDGIAGSAEDLPAIVGGVVVVGLVGVELCTIWSPAIISIFGTTGSSAFAGISGNGTFDGITGVCTSGFGLLIDSSAYSICGT